MTAMTSHKHTSKLSLISILLLTVMLLSFVSHSHDYHVDDSQTIEQIDCQLCQQHIYPLNDKVKPREVKVGYFLSIAKPVSDVSPDTSKQRSANPRAPPYLT